MSSPGSNPCTLQGRVSGGQVEMAVGWWKWWWAGESGGGQVEVVVGRWKWWWAGGSRGAHPGGQFITIRRLQLELLT